MEFYSIILDVSSFFVLCLYYCILLFMPIAVVYEYDNN